MVACGLSLVTESGDDSNCGLWVSHCSVLSGCGARSLRRMGFSGCGSWALEGWLRSSVYRLS